MDELTTAAQEGMQQFAGETWRETGGEIALRRSAALPQIRGVRSVPAEEVNRPFIERGWEPPYQPGTRARVFETASDLEFVRVHGTRNPIGRFLVRKKAIAGMTPEEIQQFLALPQMPTHIRPVIVPEGTAMQMGRVAAQPKFGVPRPGGIQYQLLEDIPTFSFGPSTPLQ